jgi:hypothetical protein
MTRAWLSWLVVLAVACSGRMTGSGRDAGARLDAGRAPDSGVPEEDAGRPSSCVCPTYPSSCTPPAVNEPTFTPEADAMGAQLFAVIACATSSLHIAMYEGEWPCIADALESALEADADLTIDIVTDDDQCPAGACVFDVIDASDRVTVVRDTRGAYMHHKWVIADGTRVWVASSNFSDRSYCSDHNNAIVVEQPEIVQRYEAVFQRMFTEGNFSPVAPEAPTTAGDYTVYFSPESTTDDLPPAWHDAMLAEIALAGAGMRVDALINAWTREDVAAALIAARDRGAEVQAVVAHTYANDAPAQLLLAAGVPIREDGVHDKVLVIGDLVITGSANWSDNAFGNNENILWIRNAGVAQAYRGEIDRVFAAASLVDPVTP